MRKILLSSGVVLFLICLGCIAEARNGRPLLSFQNFVAEQGVTIDIPYEMNSGTRRNPDTITLVVDMSAPVLEFQLTVVGRGFNRGRYCELEWDNGKNFGAPQQDIRVQIADGGFGITQKFSLSPTQLNMRNNRSQTVLYQLEVEEENRVRDVERFLQITYINRDYNRSKPTRRDSAYVERIPYERAVEIAVAEVGGGTVTGVELQRENGRLVYEVEIVYEGLNYEVYIDAETGVVIGVKIDTD